jgi:hypothetical protein
MVEGSGVYCARSIRAINLMEDIQMINYELREDEEILVLRPEGSLEVADFTKLTTQVDAYLERHGQLRGVLIQAKSFPGWKDFHALLAQLKFVKEHHERMEKVAVVADGAFANIMPNIIRPFIHAEVQHFAPAHEEAAWNWLRQSGTPGRRSGAERNPAMYDRNNP